MCDTVKLNDKTGKKECRKTWDRTKNKKETTDTQNSDCGPDEVV